MEESLGIGKRSYGTDTETPSWFRLPIPKPGFGHTLRLRMSGNLTEYLLGDGIGPLSEILAINDT